MKNVFFILVLLLGTQSSINGGNAWSYFIKPDPITQIKQELRTYLGNLNLSSFETAQELEQYVANSINQDMQDANKFPLYNAFINQEGFNETKNKELREKLKLALDEVSHQFVIKKVIILVNN